MEPFNFFIKEQIMKRAMRWTSTLMLAAALPLTGAVVIGCGEDEESPGERIDRAVEEAGDAAEEAGDEVEEATD